MSSTRQKEKVFATSACRRADQDWSNTIDGEYSQCSSQCHNTHPPDARTHKCTKTNSVEEDSSTVTQYNPSSAFWPGSRSLCPDAGNVHHEIL